MKKDCVKLGVVGLGRGMLVRSVLGQETVRITAICDRVPEKVQAAEEVLRPYVPELQVCGSFDELLEADIYFSFRSSCPWLIHDRFHVVCHNLIRHTAKHRKRVIQAEEKYIL